MKARLRPKFVIPRERSKSYKNSSKMGKNRPKIGMKL